MKEQPLKCEVSGDLLVVSIGINTLAWAALKKNGGPLDGVCVIDKVQFAKDVSLAITSEDETGDGPLNRFLDEMIQLAADQGSPGLKYK